MNKAIAAAVILAVFGAAQTVAQERSDLENFAEDVARHWQSATGGDFASLPLAERVGIIAWYLQQQPDGAGTRPKISAITMELNNLLRFYSALADDPALRNSVARFAEKLEKGDPLKTPPSAAGISSERVPDFLSGGQPVGGSTGRMSQPAAGGFTRASTGPPAPSGGGGGGMILPRSGLSSLAIGAIVLGMLSLALLAGVLVVRNRRAEAAAKRPSGWKIQARAEIVHSDGRRTMFEINVPVTRIGRAGDNDIVLNDERVSSRHAEIKAGPDGFLIHDLGSANGTFLRGERVTDSGLYAGDEITVGSTRIVLGG